MSTQRVFNENLQPNQYFLSDLIEDATAFYIIAPDESVEVQIDIFLQLEISVFENRQIRLFEGLTENDTRTVLIIPEELTYTNTNKRFALYSDFSVRVEIWCIYKDFSIDSNQLDSIENKLNALQTTNSINNALNAGIALNAIQQNISLGLLAASLSPITLGSSLASQPPLLTGATTLLSLTGV